MRSRTALIFLGLAAVLWISCGVSAAASPYGQATEPVPTRWISPDGLPRPTHSVPAPKGPFSVTRADQWLSVQSSPLPPAGPQGRVCLVVEDGIYDAVASGVATYQQDLEDDGYQVTVYRFVSGSAADLRSFLGGLYDESASLVGAVLVGDIPYAIYEMMEDWDGTGGVDPAYSDFPCDIFFMDLNGTWGDQTEDGEVHASNGKYDARSGDTDLEIWVSRMMTSNLAALGTETAVLNNYFAKNHSHRLRQLGDFERALVYPDDDWSYLGSEDRSCVEGIYGAAGVDMVSDPEETTAADYLSHLPLSYELIHTRSHGYYGGHAYLQSEGAVFNWVYPSDYRTLDPVALFYSFYVCSGADYSYDNCVAGTAVFNADSGLTAWGSTKTGGMWEDGSFYDALTAGHCFGEAFRVWFNTVQFQYSSLAPRWWYGMVLVGDATLPTLFFEDVPHSHWAHRQVEEVAGAGIVSGYPGGLYQPSWIVSRDQMAVFMARAISPPTGPGSLASYVPPASPSFSDVDAGDWSYNYIEYVVANDVVTGYPDGTYDPLGEVTRGQMAVFVARALAGDEASVPVDTDGASFADVTLGSSWSWCYNHVEYIAGLGVTQGYQDGLYHPEYACSRDQMAVYIARAFHL